jgi:hypothetical protein
MPSLVSDARPLVVAALLLAGGALLTAGCHEIGTALGEMTRDIPLGDAGTVTVQPDSVAATSATVRFDQVDFPDRLWIAKEVALNERAVTWAGDASESGTVTFGLLMSGHPVAAWELTVDDGGLTTIDAHRQNTDLPENTTSIPGFNIGDPGYKREAGFSSRQLEIMRAVYRRLPPEERPSIHEGLRHIVNGDSSVTDAEKNEIFRAVTRRLDRKEFTLGLMVRTEGPLSGTLTIDAFAFKIFSSGQRLMTND